MTKAFTRRTAWVCSVVALGVVVLALIYIVSQPNAVPHLAVTQFDNELSKNPKGLVQQGFPYGRYTYKSPEFQASHRLLARQPMGTVESFSYLLRTFDGIEIPIILLKPSKPKPIGLITIPGHVKQGESGLEQLSRPDKPSYQHSAALHIARAGYTTLVIELRGFGHLGYPKFVDHRTVAYNALLRGSAYQNIVLEDIRAARSFMTAETGLPSSMIGVGGASLGGELAVKYAALDPQTPFIISHSYGGRLKGPTIRRSDPKKPPHLCHILAGDNSRYSQSDLMRMIAPRPLLMLRGARNTYATTDFVQEVSKFWQRDSLTTIGVVANGRHEFFVDETLSFLRRLEGVVDEG